MIQDAFLETAAEARSLIASRDTTRRWDEPSVLDRMTVGALAAHLARAVLTTREYLEVPLPDPLPPIVTADEYYATAVGLTRDFDDDLHCAIRARSASAADAGHASVLADLDEALAALETRMRAGGLPVAVCVVNGLVLALDEYLVTRLVELVVHLDDLATSLGRETPDVSAVARACVLGCLFAVARRRHGDVDVMRALARAERVQGVFPVL